MRLAGGARTVSRDYIRIVVNGVRRLGRKLRSGPMRIAIPHAPRDRRIGFRQLLEDRNAVHRRQIEPAIGCGQRNAKKPGSCEVACEIFRQPSGCFDSVALCDYTRLEVAGSCKKSGAVGRIVVHDYPPNTAMKIAIRQRERGQRPPEMLPLAVAVQSRQTFAHWRALWESFVSLLPLDVRAPGQLTSRKLRRLDYRQGRAQREERFGGRNAPISFSNGSMGSSSF